MRATLASERAADGYARGEDLVAASAVVRPVDIGSARLPLVRAPAGTVSASLCDAASGRKRFGVTTCSRRSRFSGGGRSSRSALSPCASSSSRSCCGATTRSGAGCSSFCSSCSASALSRTSSNTQLAYYDNAADLLGIPTYPTVDGNVSGPDVKQQPNGAVTTITVPDTASKFGRSTPRSGCRRSTSPTRGSTSPSSISCTGTPDATDRLADLGRRRGDLPQRGPER